MRKALLQKTEYWDQQSLSYKLRKNRMQQLESLINSTFPKERVLKIIDLGGTEKFWTYFSQEIVNRSEITLLNIDFVGTENIKFQSIVGDATCMPEIPDQHYDIVFSNSVIEHVGDFQKQSMMANEVRRIGRYYFIQTPNYYFPVETHFLFPLFQFLPITLRARLLTQFDIGQFPRQPDYDDALQTVKSINLLTSKKLRLLFPEGKMMFEIYAGFFKSLITHNFPRNVSSDRQAP